MRPFAPQTRCASANGDYPPARSPAGEATWSREEDRRPGDIRLAAGRCDAVSDSRLKRKKTRRRCAIRRPRPMAGESRVTPFLPAGDPRITSASYDVGGCPSENRKSDHGQAHPETVARVSTCRCGNALDDEATRSTRALRSAVGAQRPRIACPGRRASAFIGDCGRADEAFALAERWRRRMLEKGWHQIVPGNAGQAVADERELL